MYSDEADYTDYLERMNTHTYEIVDAALRHPHVIVDVWGPGWKGYNQSIPLSRNVERRARRISQLERSEAVWNAAKRKAQEDWDGQERRRERRAWWGWAEVARTPGTVESFQAERLHVGPWEVREWDDGEGESDVGEGCSDAPWDIVWTISWVLPVTALNCFDPPVENANPAPQGHLQGERPSSRLALLRGSPRPVSPTASA